MAIFGWKRVKIGPLEVISPFFQILEKFDLIFPLFWENPQNVNLGRSSLKIWGCIPISPQTDAKSPFKGGFLLMPLNLGLNHQISRLFPPKEKATSERFFRLFRKIWWFKAANVNAIQLECHSPERRMPFKANPIHIGLNHQIFRKSRKKPKEVAFSWGGKSPEIWWFRDKFKGSDQL